MAAVALTLVAGAAIGWSAGWRAHVMVTPSMGRVAPVGTLVISRPTHPGDVRVGRLVVAHPPGRSGTTFVHRVVVVTGPGPASVATRGDLDGTNDPWTLTRRDVQGTPVAMVPVAGYAVRMLPWAVLGGLAIAVATHGVRAGRRRPVRIVAGALLADILLWQFRPLARMSLLAHDVTNGHGSAAVVPTGILPLHVRATGGSQVTLLPGQMGRLDVSRLAPGGAFHLDAAVRLSGWWWLVLAAWAVPLLVALLPPAPRDPPNDP